MPSLEIARDCTPHRPIQIDANLSKVYLSPATIGGIMALKIPESTHPIAYPPKLKSETNSNAARLSKGVAVKDPSASSGVTLTLQSGQSNPGQINTTDPYPIENPEKTSGERVVKSHRPNLDIELYSAVQSLT